MNQTEPGKRCCEKCSQCPDYKDGHKDYCHKKDCPCHSEPAAEKDPTVEKLKEILGEKANLIGTPGGYMSHYHCWDQKQPSACGQKLENHKQCCLCEALPPQKDKNTGWEAEFDQYFATAIKSFIASLLLSEREKWEKAYFCEKCPCITCDYRRSL